MLTVVPGWSVRDLRVPFLGVGLRRALLELEDGRETRGDLSKVPTTAAHVSSKDLHFGIVAADDWKGHWPL